MTATQKARVIRLLGQDCQIVGRFIDEHDQTCALGCLALAAGVSKSYLRKCTAGISSPSARTVVEKIRAAFGLTLQEQFAIQSRNDFVSQGAPVEVRRKRVISYVKTL